MIWCCGKRQKLTIYWTAWLWRIAFNYLRIIVQRNTISATYSVSCCKISAIFCRESNKLLKFSFSMCFFCVINSMINGERTCRYFSYSPIYRSSPRKPNLPFNVLLKRNFPPVIFLHNPFFRKTMLSIFFSSVLTAF